MKWLLYIASLGFFCWFISEVLELTSINTPVVYYLTSVYHLFAGIGIWGLHKVQNKPHFKIGLIGTALSSATYIGLIYFPIEVMYSGLEFSEFIDLHPVYKIPGIIWFVGMLLFGISILRGQFYPTWSGVVFILGTILFTITPLLGLFQDMGHVSNMIFAFTVIYMCVYALRKDT